jgi:hypothetical protein
MTLVQERPENGMQHQISAADQQFLRGFEACEILPSAFDHSAHVRLAYAYLCLGDRAPDVVAAATEKMRLALLGSYASRCGSKQISRDHHSSMGDGRLSFHERVRDLFLG